jgi:hypothetical protein
MLRLLQRVDDGGYSLRSGIELPFSGMFETISPSVTWQINDQGLRAAERVGPVSDRFRIASYGDSEAFGVSVALDDTYGRRMERLDPRVEVLNFGVPGYNAAQVARRVEATVPIYEPDLVLYLVNKNDTDDPIAISDRVVRSSLLLRLRFLYQIVIARPARVAARRSPERLALLAAQLDRIAAYTEAQGSRLLLVFMKPRTWDRARQHAAAGGFTASAALREQGQQDVVGIEDLVDLYPKRDDHLGPEAHREIAQRLCSKIASGTAARCVPIGWSPSERDRRAQVASRSEEPTRASHAP